MVNNKNKLKWNPDVYNLDTRQKYNSNSNFHQIYHYIKRGVYSIDMKVLKSPVMYQNLIDNPEQFKSALKNYLHAHSIYSTDEYLNVNREW